MRHRLKSAKSANPGNLLKFVFMHGCHLSGNKKLAIYTRLVVLEEWKYSGRLPHVASTSKVYEGDITGQQMAYQASAPGIRERYLYTSIAKKQSVVLRCFLNDCYYYISFQDQISKVSTSR